MKHLLALVCLLLFFFSGCKKPDFEQIITAHPVLEKEATLGWQDCAFFVKQNLTVCFVDVHEWRCPCDAMCKTAGAVDASLRLTAVPAGLDTTIVLTSNSDSDVIGETTIQGKKIRFTQIITPTAETCEGYGEAEKYKIVVTLE